MSEVKINRNANSITFTNNNISFSQFGIAKEILDLIENQQQEIERLKEELEYTIPIVEHNKTITKHLKEKERLNDALKEYDRGTYCKLINENRKLNNIITGLEIELYAKYQEHKDSECEELYAKAQEDKEILDYIKELKGSDK